MLKKYDCLKENLKNPETKKYYDIIKKKKISLFFKRIFDIFCSLVMLIILSPVILVFSIIIKCDSKGPVFFRQIRVKRYGETFKIFKFRTMIVNAEAVGTQVTTDNDPRITKIGNVIRKFRIDEIPQIINIFLGDMSFVGTRPEVPRYVEKYTDEMLATLLMPQGLTSLASIEFKDESTMLDNSSNPDETYVNEILPEKMKYNLQYISKFNFFYDIKLMFKTFFAVLK
ncbi:MAG: sugar transferase [Oscillospiraceae bacterium]